ncbi:MAG: response regulator [Candidatus Binatia bacterium]
MTAVPALGPEPIRVVIVDDVDDIRLLLRLQFQRDARFDVVGEGADGLDAIALAEEHQPDLVVLDRHMPRLGGTEAIPEIRRRAPGAAIVLYTANADPRTCQAGLDAGALDVFEKGVGGRGFVDTLVGSILDRVGGARGTMEVRVGPVSSAAARVWVANTRKILDAVEAHPEELGERVPEDIFGLFRSFLDEWDAVATSTEEFRWVARANAEDVSRIVGYWAAIDSLTDTQLDRLGIHWSPPEGESFFTELTTGVLEALRRHDATSRLAARLDEQWAPYRRDA